MAVAGDDGGGGGGGDDDGVSSMAAMTARLRHGGVATAMVAVKKW